MSQAKSKILFVDDEIENLRNFQDALESAGYKAIGIEDPTKVLDRLTADRSVETVVLDYKMPKMNGIELLKEIHIQFPYIPVILLSGFITKEMLMDAVQWGIFGVLEKPVRSEPLIQMCQEAVEAYRQIQSMDELMNQVSKKAA